jgi:ABC-type multidrug transport system fused ATPase/permease subunit
MNVPQTIKASLALLNQRDRRILTLVTLVQMGTAFLDLIGVLLIGVMAALSVAVVSKQPPPTLVLSFLDRLGIGVADLSTLALAFGAAAGIVLICKSAVNMVLTRRVLRFLSNRQALVSGRLAAELLARPLLQVQRRSSQQTVYALTSGVSYAILTVLGQAVVAVTEIALLVVFSIGLVVLDPILTLFTFGFFLAIGLLLQRILSGWAGNLGSRSTQADVASYALAQEALRTYREVVVSNRRGFYVQRFQSLRWNAASVQSDLQFMGLIPKYVFEVALVVGAGLLAVSQFLTKDVFAAVTVIAVFLAAGSRIVPSIMRLQGAAMTVRTGSGQAAPTFELAQELQADANRVTNLNSAESLSPIRIRELLELGHPDFDPTVEVSHVWLTYPGASEPAIAEMTLTLRSGSSLALVGPTGAGKSTLADVILGVLKPDMGEVLIGGLSPAEAIARWPGALAYVPQEVAMANGTVRENVALGLPSSAIDDGWVWDALERAYLATFLRDSRDGLDTVIGENGMKLSGGQRQRLGVARALYTRPKLLVLDEATSALDAETEQGIAKTLKELEGNVTTVTIAHRLATIRHCDLVVYIEGGGIVASGSFEDVRKVAPHFDQQARLLGL